MGKIIRLDEDTINKIAAGEVIDRPASVVKELVENSIDAEATSITIDIKNGGKSLISVIDNGYGIMRDDLPYLFERHATSKINSIEDLMNIRTLGFRGEAMSSIVAVADIELESQSKDDSIGSRIIINSGRIIDKKEISTSIGTIVKVKNLFKNTPARLKFLKSDKTELNYITDIVEKIALSNSHIAIKYIVDDKIIFHTPGNGDLLSVIQCIFGTKTAKMMLPVDYSNQSLSIHGFTSKPELSKGNSNYIIFAINNRVVKNNMLKEAVKTAYRTLLMNNRYPISILNISINPKVIDVNVHPTKAEIKFADNKSVFNLIYYSISQVLNNSNMTYTESFKDAEELSVKETITEKDDYINVNMFDIIEKKSFNERSSFDKKPLNNTHYNYDNSYKSKNEYINPVSKDMDIDNSSNGQIIGTLFNTYIIYQMDESFMVIDQHAAHERILYEELIEKTKHKNIEQQPLLMPIIIELTLKEKNLIEEYMDLLKDLGFEFEFFGKNSVAIRQVPIIFGEPCSGYMISELLDTIDNYKNDHSSVYEKTIAQIACKSAVKAGKNLSDIEIEELIRRLLKSKIPYTCPHGRPTMITMDKTELEKKFKRII
ncbi:DNA mismatch repair endonuclease MutL [Lutispora thermophila]|uniref:DNA mismatch repair protein MutL n=1 Tax=Lutispora thermophila DSM 19022 TaxID=1122184 RepID=A0A1M6F918_9FIRM|nr:DNA mismatch repair endonuclease MutL [Lutispora thermophila]SHI94172.1 DNA mismatch repair protein MutL [Lutispora thermophila DSM 19022]